MKKSTVVCIIVASSLILAGLLIFSTVMSILKWDFTKLSTTKLETNEHVIDEDFDSICIDTDTADIEFVMSEDEKTSVVCIEYVNERHAVAVKDGALTIELENTRKWYEHIGINFGSTKIKVYLPESEYTSLLIKMHTSDVKIPNDFIFENVDILGSTGDVSCFASACELIKIKTSTGNIELEGISSHKLDLTVTTGKVNLSNVECEGDIEINVSTGKSYLENVKCKSLLSKGDTGDINLINVVATEMFSIERNTGDVNFERCDAFGIYVETDTGDVDASFLTDKVVIYETDTGDVSIPKSTAGGRCEISTDTGDITVTILN
ncbi:MAG: DUF4097 family beta strand repeat protein [Clostridia bacterium]|nr:DUF4097 family beta strand repeat protein [Clostridia bacterium]